MSVLEIPFRNGSRRYALACDVNAFCELETEFDKPICEIILHFADTENLRVEDVRRFLSVVLRDTSAPLTRQQADAIVAGSGLPICANAVTQYLMHNFGDVEETPKPSWFMTFVRRLRFWKSEV
jgi:hypothetical protein